MLKVKESIHVVFDESVYKPKDECYYLLLLTENDQNSSKEKSPKIAKKNEGSSTTEEISPIAESYESQLEALKEQVERDDVPNG